MTDKEVLLHSNAIINSSRTRGKFVFLCEGEISEVIQNNTYNPSALRRLEHLQDSSFYKKCLNPYIQKFKLPVFVNCGGKTDVIKVYNKIVSLINENESNKLKSNINLDMLYAILDLDLQKSYINSVVTSEDIFHSLYKDTDIIDKKIPSNKVLVTGLIHKEAYFLLPKFNDILLNHKIQLKYNNIDLNDINDIYNDIYNDMDSDADLKLNLDRALTRFKSTSLSDLNDLKIHCIKEIRTNNNYKYLFTIRKVKPYWEKISNNSIDNERLREQLSLEIAHKISIDNDKKCHITAIFNEIIK